MNIVLLLSNLIKTGESSSWYVWAGIGAAALLIIIVLLVILRRKKKN